MLNGCRSKAVQFVHTSPEVEEVFVAGSASSLTEGTSAQSCSPDACSTGRLTLHSWAWILHLRFRDSAGAVLCEGAHASSCFPWGSIQPQVDPVLILQAPRWVFSVYLELQGFRPLLEPSHPLRSWRWRKLGLLTYASGSVRPRLPRGCSRCLPRAEVVALV